MMGGSTVRNMMTPEEVEEYCCSCLDIPDNKLELMQEFDRLMKRMDHRYFLKYEKERPLAMLIHSLYFDRH